jgi:uncharacterized protein YgiM (DUF1202 family)
MSAQFKIRWPVDGRIITQRFGENPEVYAKFNQAGHEGLDFLTPVGGNVYACADGKVLDVRPNDGNAYGLHVKLQHVVNGREYRTVYAHLSRTLVSEGQSVRAGDRIALSGNTGHSFGPHLHLTLKLIGAKIPGYPDGVIDPLPYLQEGEPPTPSDLSVYTTDQVRLRARPTTASAHLTWLNKGEELIVLGDADAARTKVGQQGEWIQIRRADGMDGHVAAWYLQLERPVAPPPGPEPEPEPEPIGSLVIYASEPLNVRNGPSTGTGRIAVALPDEPLEVLGDAHAALTKVGDRGEWLHVRLSGGTRGYVAAWYVQTQPGRALPPLLTVSPTEDMNMRERPTTSSRRVGRLLANALLTVRDDPARGEVLVGRYGEWLYVETAEGQRGWVAAWYVEVQPPSFAVSESVPEAEPARPLVVYTTEPLNVRNGPSPNTSRIAVALPHEPLTALDDPRDARSILGEQGEWLQVRLPDGPEGYVAAWYVGTDPGPAPSALLTVYPTQDMNMRERPDVSARLVEQLAHNAPLTVHDDPARAEVLVGRYDEWLYVETAEGQRGWVAAWYVSTVET